MKIRAGARDERKCGKGREVRENYGGELQTRTLDCKFVKKNVNDRDVNGIERMLSLLPKTLHSGGKLTEQRGKFRKSVNCFKVITKERVDDSTDCEFGEKKLDEFD